MNQIKKYGVKLIVFAMSSLSAGAAFAECGVASYYWQGKVTANGERYHADGISAAHKTLPFGTRVLVKNQRNGRTITVRINDRGPFIKGRIIDLSRGANRIFGMDGVAPVCISVLSYGNGRYVGNSGRARVAGVSRRKGHVTLASLSERRKIRLARRTQPGRVASLKARRYSAAATSKTIRQAVADARRASRS